MDQTPFSRFPWEEGPETSSLARSFDMPPITVNWSDLEIAFERNSPDQESFLDLETGDLLSIMEGEPDAPARRAKVANNQTRFLRVDPASSREQYRWMERFVGSVQDMALRERLLVAIDGKGAFRRFKDVLLAFPAERERWFTYRSELLHFHIQTWIEHMEVQFSNPPPWGKVNAPADLPEMPRTITTGEAPGEILRRQARELIDAITAAELPSALAFPEFLRERGTTSLLGSSATRTAMGTARKPPASSSGKDADFDDDDDEALKDAAAGGLG
jgi:hypothetical protein